MGNMTWGGEALEEHFPRSHKGEGVRKEGEKGQEEESPAHQENNKPGKVQSRKNS